MWEEQVSKPPFTSLLSATRLRRASRSSRGSPFLGKGKVSLLRAAEGPGLKPAPYKGPAGPRQAWSRAGARGARQGFPLPAAPSARTPRGFSDRKCLCGPQCPLTRAPRPWPTRPVPRTPQSWGHIPEQRNLGFPQPRREMAWSPSPPPPEVSSFLQGRGGLQGLPSCAARTAKSTLPRAAKAARAHTHAHSHSRTSTRSHACTDTHASLGSGKTAQMDAGLALFPSFPTGGARGAGRGQRRN